VQVMSARFMDQLLTLQSRHEFIGDVRGKGLMLGMEIIDPECMDEIGRPQGSGALARKLQAACFSEGLIVELGGRHGAVMRLLPPLNVSAAQVDDICGAIARACQIVDGPQDRSGPKRRPANEGTELANLAALAERCVGSMETSGVGQSAQ
jgi:diaminobutyrate-2-oxoglutarate transaminase